MIRRRRLYRWLTLALLVATSACFRLARKSPPVERFVVGGARTAAPSSAARDSSAELSIGLRRLDLAPYLATLAIVVRREDNEIITTGFHRWAEGPSTGLNRALSGYLAAAPSIRSVDVAPWPVRAKHDYLVQVHVARFEGVRQRRGGAGEAQLLARWEIIQPEDDAILARGLTDYRAGDWSNDDYAGLVSRLDLGLLQLSQELLGCLRRLGPRPAARRADAPAVPLEQQAPIDCVVPPR